MLCGWVSCRVLRLYSTPLFGPVVVTSWPTLGSSLVLIRLVRVGTPVTLTFIVTSLQKGSQRRTKRIWCCCLALHCWQGVQLEQCWRQCTVTRVEKKGTKNSQASSETKLTEFGRKGILGFCTTYQRCNLGQKRKGKVWQAHVLVSRTFAGGFHLLGENRRVF